MIDIKFVLENHSGFTQAMEAIKADVGESHKRVNAERETIQGLQQTLAAKTSTGTVEYKQLDAELTKRVADLQVTLQLQRKEFMGREAAIYHRVYQEIEQECYAFARENGIAAVLRFNGEGVNQDQPGEILQHINKPVVWFDQTLDITKIIVARLESRRGPRVSQRDTTRPRRGSLAPPSGYRK